MKHIKTFILLLIMLLSFLLTACDSNDGDGNIGTDTADISQTSTDTLKYGNITLNNKTGTTLGGLFCSADNKIFFSNFNDNGYIYSYDKETEKSEPVVKMPARFINYYDGKLYFLFIYSEDYFDTHNKAFIGELYCCDIQSSECVKLAESQVINGLVVTNEGIYYNQIPIPGSSLDPPELWRLRFGEKEPERCNYTYFLRDEDRLIDAKGLHELDKSKLDIASDMPLEIGVDENGIKGACVYNNKLLTYSDKVLNITDLSDGSISRVNISELEKADNNIKINLSDFIVLGDYLYIAYNSNFLCRVCLSDNEPEFICDTEGAYSFSKLYTDEKDLYALGYNGEPKIVKLEINEDKITTKELK